VPSGKRSTGGAFWFAFADVRGESLTNDQIDRVVYGS